jgi:methylenetetrahydrofolate reductase (NADPH)
MVHTSWVISYNSNQDKGCPMLELQKFTTLVEVVPPANGDPHPILDQLQNISHLAIDGFNIASNPVGKPRMSALALSSLIQQKTNKPAVLHCTVRDHNKISLQSELWGARALGIQTVIITTGDHLPPKQKQEAKFVGDLDVLNLIGMAQETGFQTGVVFSPSSNENFSLEKNRLTAKIQKGAKFVVTQPVFDTKQAHQIQLLLSDLEIPLLMSVLPLWSSKHARFMDQQISGIDIPRGILREIENTAQAQETSLKLAQDMIKISRKLFQGVCIMPPFQKYFLVEKLLEI